MAILHLFAHQNSAIFTGFQQLILTRPNTEKRRNGVPKRGTKTPPKPVLGRDGVQPDSSGAVVRAIGGHHLLDVHQDRHACSRTFTGRNEGGYLTSFLTSSLT